MRSPFPGMHPYLEQPAIWQDFHNRFLTYLGEALAGRLPEAYDARVEGQLRLVDGPPLAEGAYRPDLAVLRDDAFPPDQFGGAGAGGGGAAVAEPAILGLPAAYQEEITETALLIHRWPEGDLVAAIELLSPHNKSGDGLADFRRKRRAMLALPIHWVEIDLLTGGTRMPFDRPLPRCDHYAAVARAGQRPRLEVYAWTIRQPLPTIPIPLRAPDADVPLDLGAVFADTYRRTRLDKALRRLSVGPPPARLSQEDAAWAAALARQPPA